MTSFYHTLFTVFYNYTFFRLTFKIYFYSALLQDRSRKRVLFALDQRVLGILSRVSNHATQKTNTIEGIFDNDQDQEEDGMDSATCTKLVALLVSFKN